MSQPYLEPAPSESRRWANHFAFAPKEDLVAFRSPEAALAVVRKIRGDVVAQFPAGQVHAFTPDGTQLVVSDARGILRFRDVATGRIVRTLRLDDKPAETFKVAAIQAVSQFGRPEENREHLGELVQQSARAGAEVVVLPETAVTGYMSADLMQTWQVPGQAVTQGLTGVDPKDAAETVPGPTTEFFGKLAARYGIYLTVPLLEADRKTGRYYNTVVLLGPDGRVLIHYRKLNPWSWAEAGWATAGDLGRPVADTPLGRLGVLICYDIHKQAAELAALKVDTLLYSIAWVEDAGSDWFARGLPAVAKQGGFNIVGANWAVPEDTEPAWHGFGQSEILTAAGQAAGRASGEKGDQIIYAELPLPGSEE
jgi:predicted amidohydrolase